MDVPSNAGAAASVVRDPRPAWPDETEEVYRALVLGLRDYVRKNGFREVVLGLSGGIDSALTAVIAADALGPEAVRTLAMPSPYSSPESPRTRSRSLDRLGIRLDVVPIERRVRGIPRRAGAGVRRAPRRASPRRTSRLGSAATC